MVPGLGHALLKRWRRGVVFFCLVLFSASLGALLEGKLFVAAADQPLSRLGTIASMGMGAPYFLLRHMLDYEGNILSATYEYGGAFLLTAGLMNLLVVLDVWDIRQGARSSGDRSQLVSHLTLMTIYAVQISLVFCSAVATPTCRAASSVPSAPGRTHARRPARRLADVSVSARAAG